MFVFHDNELMANPVDWPGATGSALLAAIHARGPDAAGLRDACDLRVHLPLRPSLKTPLAQAQFWTGVIGSVSL
jgi:hypothetical protein